MLILGDPGGMAEPCRAAGPSVLCWSGAGPQRLPTAVPAEVSEGRQEGGLNLHRHKPTCPVRGWCVSPQHAESRRRPSGAPSSVA